MREPVEHTLHTVIMIKIFEQMSYKILLLEGSIFC